MKDSIKVGSTFILIMGMFALVLSILWIFITEIAFISDVGVYTGLPWEQFLETYPAQAMLYIITKKLLGVQLLAISILIVLINNNSYRKGEKWSWYAILAAGDILWGSMIIYRFIIGYIESSGMITFIAGLALLIIGLALPAKQFLRQKSS